jgi:hypothetical protein
MFHVPKLHPQVQSGLIEALKHTLADPNLAVGVANTILLGQTYLISNLVIEQAQATSRKQVYGK